MIQLQKIIVPTDFSEQGRSALKYACAFADEFATVVHLFHALGHLSSGHPEIGLSGLPMDQFENELRTKATAQMEELQGLWSEFSFPLHREVRTGEPFVEIVRYAREIDAGLIVMGTHGRSAIPHLLMGSVAENVVRKAPCPVLTVRHPEHEFVMP